MQSGGRDGNRSNTPVAMNLEGRIMFASQPPSSHALPSLGNSSPYPSIPSSPSQINHGVFTGSKYLSGSTPPEAHSRYVSEAYRVSPPELVDHSRFGIDCHRGMPSELYKLQSQQLQQDQLGDPTRATSDIRRIREEQGQTVDYHRSNQDFYQNNNPIDLQQRSSVSNNHQLNSAQKLVSEIQRIQTDPQRQMNDLRNEQLSRIIPSVSSATGVVSNSSGSLVSNSPLNYRQVMDNVHHRLIMEGQLSSKVSHDSTLRTHANPQRLVQESFREFLSTSQRHFMDDLRPVNSDCQRQGNTNSDNVRYLPGLNLQSPRSLVAGDIRLSEEEVPPPHSVIPQTVRGTNSIEGIRISTSIDGNRHSIAENLRLVENQSIIQDSMRLETDTPQSMVPENLCLTETSHSQVLQESLHTRHEPASRLELVDNNNRINQSNHSHIPPSESPIAMVRHQYGTNSSTNPTPSPHRLIASDSQPPLRVQSPHYSESMYRTDIHNNIGTPAPPTPAPSVPPMPEQSSTPLPPQYYAYSHSSHASHSNTFPVYMNDSFEERDSLTLEEKIERGYHDIKPFDQDYPVSMPMMHVPQNVAPPPPPQVPKPPKPKKAKEPKPPRMPIVHKCNECLRIFKNSTQLKNHMWRHTGEKPFTCDECGSKFTQQGNLRAHRRIHTGERPYQCTECKACFTQLSTLKTHQKIHSDERPYKCSDCDAAFRQIANLKTHLVTHTGERPHKCDQCEKAFTQKSNLKAHKNRVHIAEGITVHAKRGRKKNPTAIKPFTCLECGAKFTVLSNLKIHAKLHSGNKPFECDHCGAGFAQRSNLKTHIQRMHGKAEGQPRRRIRCDECPAMFRLRRCLKTHKKRRHPIKSLKIKILKESNHHLNSAFVESEATNEVDDEGDNDDDDECEYDEEEDGEEEEEEGMYEEEGMDDEMTSTGNVQLASKNVLGRIYNGNGHSEEVVRDGFRPLKEENHLHRLYIPSEKDQLARCDYDNLIDHRVVEPKIEIMSQSPSAPVFTDEREQMQQQQQQQQQRYVNSDASASSPTLDGVSAKMTCIGRVQNALANPVAAYEDGIPLPGHSSTNLNNYNHFRPTDQLPPSYNPESLASSSSCNYPPLGEPQTS